MPIGQLNLEQGVTFFGFFKELNFSLADVRKFL